MTEATVRLPGTSRTVLATEQLVSTPAKDGDKDVRPVVYVAVTLCESLRDQEGR